MRPRLSNTQPNNRQSRCMQHEKHQWKFEKGWYNVIQKVKTLPINKDKNGAAGFSLVSNTLAN